MADTTTVNGNTTFKGDTTLLGTDQLKANLDALVQGLGDSAKSVLGEYYMKAYNAEAKLANAAFAAGQQAANEQAKSDYFKKNGTFRQLRWGMTLFPPRLAI
ncbi:hypothetical protein [Lentilactobacillus rapi]|uniref:hypothetical protein n=1 Tax=Lentilactobacillus rapi TaxID=481723 RepID=UPI001FB48826|nr:hypothetical protein [Lentilactobacillus rapi]